MNDITRLLQAAQEGDSQAGDQLMSLVYSDLRRMAARKMAFEDDCHTLQPTALVHEAWLRLARKGERNFQNRGHFFAVASEAMRRILIDDARRRSRHKRGCRPERVNLEGLAISQPAREDILLKLDEALQQLESENPEKAQIVKLKYFGGLTNQEAAESMGVTERTVERAWAYAKAWLCRAIQSME